MVTGDDSELHQAQIVRVISKFNHSSTRIIIIIIIKITLHHCKNNTNDIISTFNDITVNRSKNFLLVHIQAEK